MRTAPLHPRLQLFVCANRRAADDALGPGCSGYGELLYAALKDGVAGRGIRGDVWVTKTYCLGICPKRGATLAMYPPGAILMEVEAADAEGILERALRVEAACEKRVRG